MVYLVTFFYNTMAPIARIFGKQITYPVPGSATHLRSLILNWSDLCSKSSGVEKIVSKKVKNDKKICETIFSSNFYVQVMTINDNYFNGFFRSV